MICFILKLFYIISIIFGSVNTVQKGICIKCRKKGKENPVNGKKWGKTEKICMICQKNIKIRKNIG